jgi:hypothetical protein
MLRRVALVRTDVSEELSASFIRVTRIGELGRTLAVTGNRRTLRRNNYLLRFEVFTAVTMKNGVFWDVTQCGSCKKNVSEKCSTSFIGVTRIDELGTTLAVTSNRRTLRRYKSQCCS